MIDLLQESNFDIRELDDTTDTLYVFEFKVDGTPEEALAQINSKGYSIPYQLGDWKIIKVGVNFDSATRTIGTWKTER